MCFIGKTALSSDRLYLGLCCFLKYQAFEENCGDLSFNPEMGILVVNNNTKI